MSRPTKDDIAHRKGWRQRARVRGRELIRQEQKRKKKPTRKKRP